MKLALAQLKPVIGDLDGNSEKIFEVCEEIKDKDVDLVITPELSLIGYPPHQKSLFCLKGYSDP